MIQSSARPLILIRQRTHAVQLSTGRWLRDKGAQLTLAALAASVGLLVVGIAGALVFRSAPLIQSYSVTDLLTGQSWRPSAGVFGFAPFLAGSVAVTLVAMALAVLPGVLSGIYLAEYMSNRTRGYVKPLLDMLVGIPSVIFGLWGILVVVPLVREHVGPFLGSTLGANAAHSSASPTPAATACWRRAWCWLSWSTR